MKKLIMLLVVVAMPCYLWAQGTTIGKTKEEIRNIIQSNPNFKLLRGDDSDTLSFQPGMQTIFLYKDNLCYESKSIFPLQYMNALVQKMTEDSYKKIKDNVWINAVQTIKVEITIDKKTDQCIVDTSTLD